MPVMKMKTKGMSISSQQIKEAKKKIKFAYGLTREVTDQEVQETVDNIDRKNGDYDDSIGQLAASLETGNHPIIFQIQRKPDGSIDRKAFQASDEAKRAAYERQQRASAENRIRLIARLRQQGKEAQAKGEDDMWTEMADELENKKSLKTKTKMSAETAITQGLEPVFSAMHQYHERIFYDPKEGKYYDSARDMFMTLEEARAFGIKGLQTMDVKTKRYVDSYNGFFTLANSTGRNTVEVMVFRDTDEEESDPVAGPFNGETADAYKQAHQWIDSNQNKKAMKTLSPKIQAAVKNYNQRQAELIELRVMVKAINDGLVEKKDLSSILASMLGGAAAGGSEYLPPVKDEKKPKDDKKAMPIGIVEKTMVGHVKTKAQETPRPEIGDSFTDDGEQVTVRFVGTFDDYVGKWRVKVEGNTNWVFFTPNKSLKGAKTKADPSISWTPEKLQKFKAAYDAAGGDTFTFEGNEFVKSYAKYLIEYLEGQFGGKSLKSLKTKIKSLVIQDEIQTARELKELVGLIKSLAYTSGRPRVHTYGTEDEINAAIREYETFARANPNDPLGRDLLETVADLRDELKMRQEVRNQSRKDMPIGILEKEIVGHVKAAPKKAKKDEKDGTGLPDSTSPEMLGD